MKIIDPRVDEFFEKEKRWKEEMLLLRSIMNEAGLTEEFKWKHPCYTFNGKNIVIIGGFKEYCSLMLFKGALMKDEAKILVQPTETGQATRQIRFTNTDQINQQKDLIKTYMFDAIEVEKSGKKIEYKKTKDFDVPEELTKKFKEDKHFKKAFESLTPGRQRGYLLFFAGAKQSQTRDTRIEKHRERIMKGKGIDDCVCGLSKRMPRCDGSHKNIC